MHTSPTTVIALASASLAAAAAVIAIVWRAKAKKPASPSIILPRKEAANGVLRPFVIERVLKRRGALHIFETLPPKHTAFVVVDMQRTFLDVGGGTGLLGTVGASLPPEGVSST